MQENKINDYMFLCGYVHGLNNFLRGLNYNFVLKLGFLDLEGRDFSINLIKEIFKNSKPEVAVLRESNKNSIEQHISKYGYEMPVLTEKEINGKPILGYPEGPFVKKALEDFFKSLNKVVDLSAKDSFIYEYVCGSDDDELSLYVSGFNYVLHNQGGGIVVFVHGEEID